MEEGTNMKSKKHGNVSETSFSSGGFTSGRIVEYYFKIDNDDTIEMVVFRGYVTEYVKKEGQWEKFGDGKYIGTVKEAREYCIKTLQDRYNKQQEEKQCKLIPE